MYFNRILVFPFLLIAATCFSQDSNTDIRDVTKANFFDPGFSYEKRIGKLQSLNAKAFLSSEIYIGYSSSLGNTSHIDFDPALSLQYRRYYNAEKRKARGKRIEMNSLNYVGALTRVSFYKESISFLDQNDLRAAKSFGLVWGFQRNYPSRFSLDLSLGLGFVVSKKTTINDAGQFVTKNFWQSTTLGEIGLGFWLNKRE